MLAAHENIVKHCQPSNTSQLHGKKETSEFRNLHCQIQLLITGRNKGKQIFIHNNNVIEKKLKFPRNYMYHFHSIYELRTRMKCPEDNEIEKLMNFLRLCYAYITSPDAQNH